MLAALERQPGFACHGIHTRLLECTALLPEAIEATKNTVVGEALRQFEGFLRGMGD